jgi:preprotein translocase subunit YajC
MKLLKMNSRLFLILLMFFSNFLIAQKIECSTVECIQNAMKNAKPGDEIIIADGVYAPTNKVEDNLGKFVRFTSTVNGTAAKPITLRGKSTGAKRPILKVPDNDLYDGAVISINGDYWVFKDLILEQGAKGIMIDNSNFTKIINVKVNNVGEEAIHIRDGSSNCLIDACEVTLTGRGKDKAGFGEAIYIGSDGADHATPGGTNKNKYNRDCKNNTVQNCILGPNISAEPMDIKEGTDYTVVKNNTFDATGMTGANFSDSFIDIKGINGFIYNNTFNVKGSSVLQSIIDFNNRKTKDYNYKTGERVAIFGNTINLSDKGTLPTARSKGEVSKDIHVWNNIRVPNTPYIKDANTAASIKEFCPTWNIIPCATLGVDDEFSNEFSKISVYPNPANNYIEINGLPLDKTSQIDLFNIQGQKILFVDKNNGAGIDVSNLSSGTYLLKIKESGASKLFIKN